MLFGTLRNTLYSTQNEEDAILIETDVQDHRYNCWYERELTASALMGKGG